MESILGILNGTANFILTQMTATGMAFGQALKLASEKGFAEADPSLDVDGHDTAHKLVLLILLAFGRHYPLDKLPVQGIRGVEPMDIEYAREFGLHLKLVAEARQPKRRRGSRGLPGPGPGEQPPWPQWKAPSTPCAWRATPDPSCSTATAPGPCPRPEPCWPTS